MADWEPASARPVADGSDWEPASARIPVKAHSRGRHPVLRGIAQGLPAAGALLGGSLGGAAGAATSVPTAGAISPFTVPSFAAAGAGVGAAGGEAGRQLLLRAIGEQTTATPGRDIALQAALGTTTELGGQGLMAGAKAAAPAVMRAAILPSKAIRLAFEDVGKTALEEGVGVGGGRLGQKILGGARKANELRAASSAAEDALLQQAEQQGVKFQVTDLAQPIIDRAETKLGRALNPKEARRVLQQVWGVVNDAFRANTFGALRRAPNVLRPAEVKMVKQYAQDASKGILSKEAQAVVAAGNPKAARAVAGLAKDALETIPGVAEQTAKTQSLIGLTRAVRSREVGTGIPVALRLGMRGGPAALGATLGAVAPGSPTEKVERGLGGAALGAGLTSPLTLSILAHAMNNPLLASLLFRAAPRALQGAAAATGP